MTSGNYALVALGLTLVYSILGVPNFSHGALFMLGAFVAYGLVSAGLPVLIAVAASMAVLGIVGALIDSTTFKPLRSAPHVALLIASFAVGVVIEGAALLVWGPNSRQISTGLSGNVVQFMGASIDQVRLMTLVGAVLLILASDTVIRRTRFGRAMRAVEQNPIGAAVSGINVDRVYRLTMVVSSALAAAAGALAGMIFSVDVHMGFLPVVKAFIVVIVGGLGSVAGSILGATILGVSESLTTTYVGSEWRDVLGFTVLILVLVVRPKGLFGRGELK